MASDPSVGSGKWTAATICRQDIVVNIYSWEIGNSRSGLQLKNSVCFELLAVQAMTTGQEETVDKINISVFTIIQ